MQHVLLGCCEVGGASQSHSRPCGDAGLLPSLTWHELNFTSRLTALHVFSIVLFPHFDNDGNDGTHLNM